MVTMALVLCPNPPTADVASHSGAIRLPCKRGGIMPQPSGGAASCHQEARHWNQAPAYGINGQAETFKSVSP